MSLKKQFLKVRPTCKVTFCLSQESLKTAKTIHLVGDFNSWNTEKTPMSKTKEGEYTTSLELNPGKNYQFRYLIDGHIWENEIEADDYQLTPYGVHNSVLEL